jgi:hypothetical protein
VFGGLEHAWEHEDRDSPEAANGDSATEYHRLRGWAGAETDLGVAKAKVAVSVRAYDFNDVSAGDGVIVMGFGDRTMLGAGLRLSRKLNYDRNVFAQGAWDARRYERAGTVDRDSDGFAAAVGALTGEVLAGALVQNYADAALSDVATFDLGAALTWMPHPLTRAQFALHRSIEETTAAKGGVPASSYTATTISAHASQRVAPQVTLGVDAGWQMASFDGINRTDDLTFFGVDVRCYLSPKVWFGAEMRHVERSSSVGAADYAANVAMIRLGVRTDDEYGADAPLATAGAS